MPLKNVHNAGLRPTRLKKEELACGAFHGFQHVNWIELDSCRLQFQLYKVRQTDPTSSKSSASHRRSRLEPRGEAR